jgi:hypothetical protein
MPLHVKTGGAGTKATGARGGGKALSCHTNTVQRVAREMPAGRTFDGASAAA